jgi:hypothetical protein
MEWRGIAGMAAVADDLGDPTNEIQAAFDFPKQKNAGVGRDLPAVKIDLDLFPLDVFKKKAFGVKIIHGCFLFGLKHNVLYFNTLPRETAFFMNNSG